VTARAHPEPLTAAGRAKNRASWQRKALVRYVDAEGILRAAKRGDLIAELVRTVLAHRDRGGKLLLSRAYAIADGLAGYDGAIKLNVSRGARSQRDEFDIDGFVRAHRVRRLRRASNPLIRDLIGDECDETVVRRLRDRVNRAMR